MHQTSAAFALWSLRPARRLDALQQLTAGAALVSGGGGGSGAPRLSTLLGVCREMERRGATEAEVAAVRQCFAQRYPRAAVFAAPSSSDAVKAEP